MPDPGVTHRLLLLRHGEVTSHRGDVPVTEAGLRTAEDVGRRLARGARRIRVLTGAPLRARQTAEALARGARASGAEAGEPQVAFALRNPDIYVAGERVDLVSSAAALAAQVPGLTEAGAAAVPFFRSFFERPDRIGWWLGLADVPGDDAATVAGRVTRFAASLADTESSPADLTVGVTQSPLLRACALAYLGRDPGEPAWVTGLEVTVGPARTVTMRAYDPAE
jgi:broad specificity phosphatase PhoE